MFQATVDNKRTRPFDFIIIKFDLCVFRIPLREKRVFLNRLLYFSLIKRKILKEIYLIYLTNLDFQ